MELASFFPMWDRLSPEHQRILTESARVREAGKGETLHDGTADCTGLLLVRSGMLRVFLLSEEGREVTLYRLGPGEICLFSSSCAVGTAAYDLFITAARDTRLWVIPTEVYKELSDRSALLAGYTNQIMADRFSQVMWLVEQILWQRLDRRLAAFLLEEQSVEGTRRLRITHEAVSRHLGCAREVVTRMLNFFQTEGMVALRRGVVEILDEDALRALT